MTDEEDISSVRKQIAECLDQLRDHIIELKEDNDSIGVSAVEKQIGLVERALDIVTDVIIDDNVDQKAMVDAALRIALSTRTAP